MDINDERLIGRMLRDKAKEIGLNLLPEGFRVIINVDESADPDELPVIHAIFVADREMVERAVAGELEGGEQLAIDEQLAEIERNMKRDEVREKAEAARQAIIDELKSDGGFL